MAAVIYECKDCDKTWPDGLDVCPNCGSDNVSTDWQEGNDEKENTEIDDI